MNLRDELINYKNITLKLIQSIEDVELVESLIEKRQEIVNKINLMQYENKDFKELASQLELSELEESLTRKMKKEKADVKNKVDNIRRLKQARNMYNKREGSPMFFNIKG